jgi:hypothetical protein
MAACREHLVGMFPLRTMHWENGPAVALLGNEQCYHGNQQGGDFYLSEQRGLLKETLDFFLVALIIDIQQGLLFMVPSAPPLGLRQSLMSVEHYLSENQPVYERILSSPFIPQTSLDLVQYSTVLISIQSCSLHSERVHFHSCSQSPYWSTASVSSAPLLKLGEILRHDSH